MRTFEITYFANGFIYTVRMTATSFDIGDHGELVLRNTGKSGSVNAGNWLTIEDVTDKPVKTE